MDLKIPMDSMASDDFESALGYVFTQKHYLTQALTHKSCADQESNQTLEFLGDSVLNMIISKSLFDRFPHANEGELTRMRALLVRGQTLIKIAQTLKIDKALRQSLPQKKMGCPPSALEDAVEALIGAIYLDGGFSAAENFVQCFWEVYFQSLKLDALELDAKSQLQMYCHQKKLPLPVYHIESIKGQPPHELFILKSWIGSPPLVQAQASGSTKKIAQQRAALKLLQQLHQQ